MKGLLSGLFIILLSSVAIAEEGCINRAGLETIYTKIEQAKVITEMYQVCEDTSIQLELLNDNLRAEIAEITSQRDSAQNFADVCKANLDKERENCDILIKAAKPTWGDRALWVLAGVLIALGL